MRESARDDFVREMNVSRETMEKLDHYAETLEKWNRKINLISPKSVPDIWARHFLDSAQILKIAPKSTQSWCDLGTGGGFPGLVVAIMASETASCPKFTLIESDERKATFLATIARELSLDVYVLPQRVEESEKQYADVVSARALAPLDKLLGYAHRHVNETGVFLLQKGENHLSELTDARRNWHIDCEVISSITDSSSAILKITGCQRVK